MAQGLRRGEIRFCSFPPPDKERPVVVVTRDSALRYLNRVTVAPVTSTRRGVPSEVNLDVEDGLKGPCAINLHNLVTIDQARLRGRIGELSRERLTAVCTALAFALGCDAE